MAKEQQYECGSLFYASVLNLKATSLGNNRYLSKTEIAPISKVGNNITLIKEKEEDVDITYNPNYVCSLRNSIYDPSSRGKVVGKRAVFKKVEQYKKKFGSR